LGEKKILETEHYIGKWKGTNCGLPASQIFWEDFHIDLFELALVDDYSFSHDSVITTISHYYLIIPV